MSPMSTEGCGLLPVRTIALSHQIQTEAVTENCLGDKPPLARGVRITLFVFTHTILLSMTFQLLVFANSAKETACSVSLPQSLCIINLRNAGVRETDLILDSFLTGIWGVDGLFSRSLTTGEYIVKPFRSWLLTITI